MAYKKQKQHRLPGYDYAQAGEYFVTICTKDREHFFGEIVDGIMQLSEVGVTAQNCLRAIPQQFDNTLLDEYVVMPNHVHLLLIIEYRATSRRNIINDVPTCPEDGIPNNPMRLPHDTIGKMIRWYKGKTTHECRRSNAIFAWQARFHDHIIRDRRSLNSIRDYVRDNPLQWDADVFNRTSLAYRRKFGVESQKNRQ